MRIHTPSHTPRAFTLMEVLLSMVLMVILISIVAGSVDFHLRQLTVRQTHIEEAQVARVVLRRIADDLRAVAVSRPTSSASGSAGSSGAATGAAGATDSAGASDSSTNSAQASGGNGAATNATGDNTSSSSASSTSSGTSDSSAIASSVPAGFYGTLYELQVDVSRIPRYEEYSMLAAHSNSGGIGLASDVRTVSYYTLDGTSSGMSGSGGVTMADDWSQSGAQLDASTEFPQGLVRRVVERAAERYAQEMSDYTQVQEHLDAFAPEVLWIEFRYFDGQQWTTEWDSDAMGGVPMAVEITMEIDAGTSQSNQQDTTSTSDFNEHIYRLVVHLPAAEPLTQSSDSTTATDSTTGGGT